MAVTDLSPQKVRHDSGAIVASVDRETIEYVVDGRTWQIPVDRGPEYYFLISSSPQWTDGTPLTESELASAKRVIQEAYDHWRIPIHFEQAEW
jgi:hypothetical protein